MVSFAFGRVRAGAIAFLCLSLAAPRGAAAAELLLNCEIEDAPTGDQWKQTQIRIDEDSNLVHFHAHLRGGEPMVISENTNEHIWAYSRSGSIVISKRDSRFAIGFSRPLSLPSGGTLATANSLTGSCTANPFQKSK